MCPQNDRTAGETCFLCLDPGTSLGMHRASRCLFRADRVANRFRFRIHLSRTHKLVGVKGGAAVTRKPVSSQRAVYR
jgi:hypothetical protein